MTLRQVFDNAIQPLNIERGDNSPVFIRERVVTDINAAVQMIATAPKCEYFLREEESLNLVAGTASYDLNANVLNVYLPARLGDGAPLTELGSRGEYDRFGQLYLGKTSAGPTSGKPIALFVQRRKRTGDADAVKTQVLFAPTPNSAYTCTVEVSRVPGVYTVADLATPSPTVPMPHEFVESILLPIVRWNVRTSHFFNRNDLLPSMAQEYAAALEALGLADPQTDKRDADSDLMERKKAAARDAARRAYASTT